MRDYTVIRDDAIRSKICELMSEMLDNPDEQGIYPTSEFMGKMEDYIIDRIAELEGRIIEMQVAFSRKSGRVCELEVQLRKYDTQQAEIDQVKLENKRMWEYINDHVHSFIDSDEIEKLLSYHEWKEITSKHLPTADVATTRERGMTDIQEVILVCTIPLIPFAVAALWALGT